ncbi:MAG: M1 family aminopeptidase [candidate division WOR-3 bacterium]
MIILINILFSLLIFNENQIVQEFKMVQTSEPIEPEKRLIFPWVALAESSHSYDVRHYRLDIQLPMNSGVMTAQARILLTSRIALLETLSFHFVNLVCDSVKQNGSRLNFNTPPGYLTMTLNPPLVQNDSAAIDVYYHRLAIANRGLYFYARGGNTRHNIVYTVTEPNDSRYWFPCFDEPWDKAEQGCQINITVPDSFTACANGKLDSIATNTVNRTKTYYWTHRYPISTYLICFAASRYATFSHWFQYDNDSMEVKYFIWPEDSIAATNSFANMVDMIQFFSEPNRYGLYPFIADKYGMVAVYPFQWGGMEHQTMTTIHRSWVLNGSESGISHELAHQWWGDMVTCQDWRNIWLNEGFATYSDALYHEYRNGHASFIDLMNSRAEDYFREDETERFPIYDPPPSNLFAWGTIYCKGSWILHMLRYLEGDTTATPGIFFQTLRTYGDSFRFSTANTEDYKRINERMTGLDLTNFFAEWVYQAGYPNYRVGWYCQPVNDNWQLVLNIIQNNGNNAPSVFHIPVQILVHLNSRDTLLTLPIDTSPQRNTFQFNEPVNSIEFDPNVWLLKKVQVVQGIEEIVQIDQPLGVKVFPNPFRNRVYFQLAGNGLNRIEIYNVLGDIVKSFDLCRYSNKSSHQLVWNGNDTAGRRLPAGIYFAKVSRGKKTDSIKILRLQ